MTVVCVAAIGLAGAARAQTLDTFFSSGAACAGSRVELTVVYQNGGGPSESSWQANNDPFLFNANFLGACTTDLGACQVVSQSTTTWNLDPFPAGATSTSTIRMFVQPDAAPNTVQCVTTNAVVNSTDSSDEACVTVLDPSLCAQGVPVAGGWGLGAAVLALLGIGIAARRRTRD